LNNIVLKFKESASKEFSKIPKQLQPKIYDEIQSLKASPLKGKKLKGKLSALRRIRIGKYRVAYKFIHCEIVIIVVKIGDRKDFYEQLSRLVQDMKK